MHVEHTHGAGQNGAPFVVVGLSVGEAGTRLAESILGYEITEVANPDDPSTPPETVWHQAPAPGTELPEGSVVVLQVTPAAPPEPVADEVPATDAPASDAPEGG